MMHDQSKAAHTNLPRYGALFVDLLIFTTHRFRTLFFWIYAESPVLDIRLNERVDAMIEVLESVMIRFLGLTSF